ncbi:MAG: pilin [Patescibacteria group bacterium]|nr:pilin [Patescibacteria group bacterium]
MLSIVKIQLKRLVSAAVWAPNGLPDGPERPGGWDDPSGYAQLKDLEWVFHRIISTLFYAGGIVAFVYLLIGGFKYLTSSGDEEAVETAKNTITYAILGLLVIVLSWLILDLLGKIISQGGKPIDLLQFELPKP